MKYCLFAILIFTSLLASRNALAITPTFFVNQEINFGILSLSPGSCLMIATSGAITTWQGDLICILPAGVQNGLYTITANPNKTVQIKVLPNLDNGNGITFNPRVYITSDSEAKGIINNSDFVEVNSGVSGVITIYLGGELSVSTMQISGQTINFNFEDAIEWNELN